MRWDRRTLRRRLRSEPGSYDDRAHASRHQYQCPVYHLEWHQCWSNRSSLPLSQSSARQRLGSPRLPVHHRRKRSWHKVLRSTTTNAYNFLDIESGMVIAQDLFIGAYNIGVNVDHAYDHVTLRNLLQTVFWDSWEGPYPTTIDNWVMNHGVALVVNRADSLDVHDFDVFHRFAGMLLTDSPDTKQNPRCGYGSGSDISLDTMENGIIVKASNAPGYVFTNLVIGSSATGQAAVQVKAGGSLPPDVLVEAGSIRGSWVLGPFPAPTTGNLTVANIIGFDLP